MVKKKIKKIQAYEKKRKNLYIPVKKQKYKTNCHRFSTNLNTFQAFVFENDNSTLLENWINIHKKKQSFYYKLYWKLLKNQIKHEEIQNLHVKKQSNWIYKNSKKNFWTKIKHNKYDSKHYSGHSIYGENVLDFGKYKYQCGITTYKKFKFYYEFSN